MMIRVLIYFIVFSVLFIAYVRYVEKWAVFYPQIGQSEIVPSNIGMAYEDVMIKTSDGLQLHAWFVPAEKYPEQAVTFLFFHGNAGNINNRVEKIELLHILGGNVLIVDYRGYGISEGKPSEKGIYLDAEASLDYLLTRKDIDKGKIIVYGVSLGGAPAAELVLHREDEVAGLVLHSTLTSAKDMAKRILPVAPSFLVQTKMDTINKVPKISIPKLIIHAPQDEVIPFWMGEKLFEAAAEPKEFLRLDGEHNDAHILSRDEYLEGMRTFLDKYFGGDGLLRDSVEERSVTRTW